MAALDLEAEYNNRQRVPDHPALQARWAKLSDSYRKEAKAELDQSYGPAPRNKFDLYRPKSGNANEAPLAVYIHGGYWQRGDREANAFVAMELNKRGVAVALPSYTLAPQASIMQIVGELRQALAAIWKKTKRRPVVVGHSAGGHLAAAMLATDWSKVDGAPADLVRAAYAISGVFELEPLVPTSINDAIKMDAAKAREASPLLWPAPKRGTTFVAAAGGDESQEFVRQALSVTAAWAKAGVTAECVVVPNANHFTILDELASPTSAMV
ncbi:MAG: alpha/beta hydrolase, partial [Proteobacteria bacterium]|nr:alpha/beta hydrolase [Pseudomonadota bacterium]